MLIDTHILLWTLEGIAGRMGPKTTELMRSVDASNLSASAASLFEIKLKQRRGGLRKFDVDAVVHELQSRAIQIIDIRANDITHIPDQETLTHADPFDLLLIATAIAEKIPLFTCDEKILGATLPGLRLVDGRQ